MKREQIFIQIAEGLMDLLGIAQDEIRPASKFTDDLGMDSLDEVESIMALEEEFDIEVTDEEAMKWRTVSDAIDYVEKQLA